MVVGLIPDREILAVKGPPVMNDAERMTMVSSLKWVDEVLTGAHMLSSSAGPLVILMLRKYWGGFDLTNPHLVTLEHTSNR